MILILEYSLWIIRRFKRVDHYTLPSTKIITKIIIYLQLPQYQSSIPSSCDLVTYTDFASICSWISRSRSACDDPLNTQINIGRLQICLADFIFRHQATRLALMPHVAALISDGQLNDQKRRLNKPDQSFHHHPLTLANSHCISLWVAQP